MKNPSFDINTRILDYNNEKVSISFLSSLCGDDMVAYIVEGITNNRGETLKDCISDADIIAILTEWSDFKALEKESFAKKTLILDYRNILDEPTMRSKPNVIYKRIGQKI